MGFPARKRIRTKATTIRRKTLRPGWKGGTTSKSLDMVPPLGNEDGSYQLSGGKRPELGS
jgi:hypothetical protein